MRVSSRITEVAFCALDENEPDADLYTVRVVWRGPGDRYGVKCRGNCLTVDGTWEWERQPSSRDDEWVGRVQYPYEDAVRLAREWAGLVRGFRGMTASEFVAWRSGAESPTHR